MATLKLEIVTPEHKAWSGDADMVLIPGSEGEMGVLPQHVPLLTEINPGELVVISKGQVHHLAVGGGFAEVGPASVNILTDMAIEDADIDAGAAEEALKRAEEHLKASHLQGEEMATVMAAIQRASAQIKVKRRHR